MKLIIAICTLTTAALGTLAAIYVYRANKQKVALPLSIHSSVPETPQRKRVLIVDDDRQILQAARLFLNGDYLVRDFEFPHDALKKVIEWHDEGKVLDLAIIDYFMARLDGVKVVKVVRALYPDSKIVFFSGAAIMLEHGQRKMVDAVWEKPLTRSFKVEVAEVLK